MYTRAMQLESTDALREWLCENCLKLQKQVQNERQDTTKSFVSKAIDYVKESIMRILTLELRRSVDTSM